MSFEDVSSTKALFAAWDKFRCGKRLRSDVLKYERHLEENIFALSESIVTGYYRHDAYVSFTIHDPKQRQIHKATVQDRLVHQAITSAIEPLFESRFIYDSYSCRKGKGTHAAVKRLRSFLYRDSHNNTLTVYALKCDIKQFFASVDHRILMELLMQKLDDQKTLDLLQRIIDSLSTAPGKGIPLGNLTSQLFANIYLHELDWFVKHALRERHYLRYCDDFIIVGLDREHLLALVPLFEKFLDQKLRLRMHPNKVTICSWAHGIDFLRYVLKPNSIVLRTKTKNRALQRVNETNLSSYLGLCSHANGYQLQQLLITRVLTAGSDS